MVFEKNQTKIRLFLFPVTLFLPPRENKARRLRTKKNEREGNKKLKEKKKEQKKKKRKGLEAQKVTKKRNEAEMRRFARAMFSLQPAVVI